MISDTTVALPTIYKRTSTGKVQEWTIEINGDKYRTISGQIGSPNLVTSSWTTCKGKNTGKTNATTGAEQATKEAEAKRRLKLEAEYKESVLDIDDLEFREPLLAKKYEDYASEIVFPVWSQPKLDGVRCIITSKGMFTRNGKPIISAPHILKSLSYIFEEYPDIEFDGELYNHELKHDFDTIISLVKQKKPTAQDLIDSEKMVQYWIYDIRHDALTFSQRYAFIHTNLFIEDSKIFGYCVRVHTAQVDSQEVLDTLYADYLTNGYEGQMVRLNGEGYEFKRSKNLLKRKEFIDEEFLLLDIEEGTGNRSGMAGFMRFEKDGKPFKANIRGGVEKYIELLKNKHLYIGQLWTVRYQNLTPDGIPRFPVAIAQRDYE